ncbi:MAG TPA: hypothetical protein VMS25_00610, partial [Candidatus Limnocylindrales bacterium]|nr:hypothetical protein [Candidatus Limnocylindrales bacterium]
KTGYSKALGLENLGVDEQRDNIILTDLYAANIKTLSSGVIVRKASLQKNLELTTNVLQALIEGLAFVKSPTHKSTVAKTLMQHLKISDPAVAEQGYRYLQRDLDITLYPPVEGLQNLQRFMKAYNPRVGEVRVTDLVDDSVIRTLSESGFVDKTFSSYRIQ